MGTLKKIGKATGIGAAALGALALATGWLLHSPRPHGNPGPDAERLAAAMERAVDLQAWERTGAVAWGFGGNQHLWDRTRGLAQVRWDDWEVLLYAGSSEGRAYRAGREVVGDDGRDAREAAHARWINDSFWLNPIAKLRDDGVRRALVHSDDGSDALLVTYTSGGLTPGDAYLWRVGPDGTPIAWRLWVSVVPIGGVEISWEGWTTLSTGARIATQHRAPLGVNVEIRDVRGAEDLRALLGSAPDPFDRLFAR